VLSSIWLATGIEAMAIMACVLPYILDHPSQKSAALTGPIQAVVTAIVFGIDGTIFVIIPLVLFLFYRSKHVKATCEARDPKVRWTDACPLPVLALSLLLALGSVSLPFTMLSHGSVVPMFGFYVSGLPASAVMILMAIVYGFAAWSCYNLKIQGWWAGLIALLGTSISFGITIARIGILPMYELMKVPQAQIEQMRAMGFLDTPFFPLTMFAVFVPYVAFIIFTRRYFKKAEVLQ